MRRNPTKLDAIRIDRDFLDRAIAKAIDCGASTVCIPDSFGSENPEQFTDLIKQIGDYPQGTFHNRVSDIDRTMIAVHCHDARGLAVDNSLAAIATGARQVECSLNDIGARKGNANLVEIVEKIKGIKK